MRAAALLAGLALLAAAPSLARERAPVQREQRHRVAAGETPFIIAWTYGVPWEAIAAANRLPQDAVPRPGQLLIIPAAPRAPAVQRPAARFAWPLEGQVRRGFVGARRSKHDGIDIAGRNGAAVRAVGDGAVIFAGEEPQKFGKLVVVDHGQGWFSAYAYLGKVAVREGARVRLGQRLGAVGRSGESQGDELHFELRRDNRPVDPLPLLRPRD
jgi:murein DD-endopeptidase MepM/ murein hydrolase activator NlpD